MAASAIADAIAHEQSRDNMSSPHSVSSLTMDSRPMDNNRDSTVSHPTGSSHPGAAVIRTTATARTIAIWTAASGTVTVWTAPAEPPEPPNIE